MAWLQLLAVMVLTHLLSASTSMIQVVDESGAPFPKVLVIVKSLEGKGEVARYLTDQNGRIPAIQFDPGLYRVIASCPYGLCKTTIREFLGLTVPAEMLVKVAVNSSDLNGEAVGAPRIRFAVESFEGKPAANAKILVRDAEAKWEKWYVADETGVVNIDLLADPSTLVVLYDGRVVSKTVALRCNSTVGASVNPDCMQIDVSQSVKLRLNR